MAKDSETVLEGFYEGPLKFPPTYKFDVGTNTYDTRLVMLGGTALNFGILTKWFLLAPEKPAKRAVLLVPFITSASIEQIISDYNRQNTKA